VRTEVCRTNHWPDRSGNLPEHRSRNPCSAALRGNAVSSPSVNRITLRDTDGTRKQPK